MGLLPCHLSCHRDNESQSNSNHLHSESSTSSISSQPSLPSVPSLNSSSSQQEQQATKTHHMCKATLKGHTSHVFSLVLGGKFLFSGSLNSEIRAWNRDSSTSYNHPTDNVIASSSGAVKSLVICEDKLFSAHQDNKIRVWKIGNDLHQKYKSIATLPTVNDQFLRCFSPNNYVRLRRHKEKTWVHHVDTVSALAVSRDGSLLYSASWDKTFKIWRTSDFRCLESVGNAHDDAISTIALSKDGFVYTGSADNKIKAWKRHAGEKKHSLVATLEKHKSAVNALALSNDGTVLYSGASDQSILVWERDGNFSDGGNSHMVLVGDIRGHTQAILCLAVVIDLVCSGSADKTVRIWRKRIDRSYACLAVLEGHQRPVKCLAAAVDSSNSKGVSDSSTSDYLVYSGSLDCNIKVWRLSVPFF
ncbi:hypothetical protein SLE2022_202570 [Rubroshorea leprosula]